MASNATEWPNGHPILRDPRNFTRSEYLIWREELSFYKRELTIQFNDKCDEKRRIQKQVDDASSRSIDDDDDDINDDGWQIQDEYWRSRLDDAWLGLQDLIEAIEIVIKKQNAESSGANSFAINSKRQMEAVKTVDLELLTQEYLRDVKEACEELRPRRSHRQTSRRILPSGIIVRLTRDEMCELMRQRREDEVFWEDLLWAYGRVSNTRYKEDAEEHRLLRLNECLMRFLAREVRARGDATRELSAWEMVHGKLGDIEPAPLAGIISGEFKITIVDETPVPLDPSSLPPLASHPDICRKFTVDELPPLIFRLHLRHVALSIALIEMEKLLNSRYPLRADLAPCQRHRIRILQDQLEQDAEIWTAVHGSPGPWRDDSFIAPTPEDRHLCHRERLARDRKLWEGLERELFHGSTPGCECGYELASEYHRVDRLVLRLAEQSQGIGPKVVRCRAPGGRFEFMVGVDGRAEVEYWGMEKDLESLRWEDGWLK